MPKTATKKKTITLFAAPLDAREKLTTTFEVAAWKKTEKAAVKAARKIYGDETWTPSRIVKITATTLNVK